MWVLVLYTPSNDDDEIEPIQFTPSPNLPIDQNGYYHLTLSENWQTPHRVSGFIHRGDDSTNGMAYTKVAWRSNLFWILEDPNCYLKAYYGDTISYYQRRGICSDFDISDIAAELISSSLSVGFVVASESSFRFGVIRSAPL